MAGQIFDPRNIAIFVIHLGTQPRPSRPPGDLGPIRGRQRGHHVIEPDRRHRAVIRIGQIVKGIGIPELGHRRDHIRRLNPILDHHIGNYELAVEGHLARCPLVHILNDLGLRPGAVPNPDFIDPPAEIVGEGAGIESGV